MSDSYKKAGVNIDEGNRFVELIRPYVQMTKRPGMLSDIGSFGGFFQLHLDDIKEPVLVSGTDGVGTKLLLAQQLTRFDTIGIDLVAMCVNDIACSGAKPLFFLDYLATGKLEAEFHAQIIHGIAKACKEVSCGLIGGETAEMPGVYHGNDFDLAGFAVGIVDKSKIIDGSTIHVGDALIGVASNGFHSNGYSLVRKIIEQQHLDLTSSFEKSGKTLGEVLLTPTKLYSNLIQKLTSEFSVHGIAHITGGGFWDNIPRILPQTVQACIDSGSWDVPLVMQRFQQYAQMSEHEFLRVFNSGIGLVLVVGQEESTEILERVHGMNEVAWKIGTISRRTEDQPSIILK
ncbi:MAG: phosphoribosylformylglycinamidine cyclo-ligase [Deltaproteobacteria bacterium RIFCSPLOWO2_02_FULL_44_10]|nr:MAG: phosphoribosylformylglycinamidine cyclo-ligase [Deltaproteobacteria bacterium RIFCSPHIGHO2_02_FULL_44_16]OGQ47443.1 MAG: phosphoribosylformylglycinamidine cyclo-ligase [Deltaproteobacteria bacterium RIFCSPLOWO2_02_FULL_44_10]